jgi:hypothetical protein
MSILFMTMLTSKTSGTKVVWVEAAEVLAGDVNAGDVITLPGASEKVRVKAVRLGSGGFHLTVTPPESDGSAAEWTVILTASTRLRRHS